MTSGTQIDLDRTGVGSPSPKGGYGEQGAPPAGGANDAGSGTAAYLTDEEILGIEPLGATTTTRRDGIPSEARNPSSIDDVGSAGAQRDSSDKTGPRNDTSQGTAAGAAMPAWMQTLAADPKHGAEAQQLWREHQEFRTAFSTPEEARAIKELLPGGVKDVLTLREATQSVDRIDAAIFSGDPRAQSEVVAEIARANPAAFRSMFAEAAKVLAGMGAGGDAVARLFRSGEDASPSAKSSGFDPSPALGTRDPGYNNPPSPKDGFDGQGPATNQQSPDISRQSPQFDPAAYASFERATNDVVARDVRVSISDTLARVLPEGVAEGAARRIGEDIFNEVHRALAADRTLSEQVGEVLRDRRFGNVEQQRVASLLAGRAKQLVPSVARRVIGEWTSSVLGTARTKAARQAAAASRVDIAAPGGSLDSMPLRQMSARDVDYASMSDDEILGM